MIQRRWEAQAGVPMEEVSKMLGHDSIKTTGKHYSQCVKARQDRLDDVMMAVWKRQEAEE